MRPCLGMSTRSSKNKGAEIADGRQTYGGQEYRNCLDTVGHHGSAYSSSLEFISTVRPRFAIISVGRRNLYGHPAPSTIEALQRAVRCPETFHRNDSIGRIRTHRAMANCISLELRRGKVATAFAISNQRCTRDYLRISGERREHVLSVLHRRLPESDSRVHTRL